MNRRDAVKVLMAMPAVAMISKAAVKPSDVIVFECDERLSMEHMAQIRDMARQIWPEPQKIIVLDRALRLKVVSGEDA